MYKKNSFTLTSSTVGSLVRIPLDLRIPMDIISFLHANLPVSFWPPSLSFFDFHFSRYFFLYPTFVTYPSNLIPISLILCLNLQTFNHFQMPSFLTLFNFVKPKNHLNIFISVTSIFSSCAYVSATVSIPYNAVGLIFTFNFFPFIFLDFSCRTKVPFSFSKHPKQLSFV